MNHLYKKLRQGLEDIEGLLMSSQATIYLGGYNSMCEKGATIGEWKYKEKDKTLFFGTKHAKPRILFHTTPYDHEIHWHLTKKGNWRCH